jgi:hypothetical protein
MSEHEYEYEPIRGLPGLLPAGEKILWQGSPQWRALARHGYHWTSISVYFALLLVWRLANSFTAGESITQSVLGTTWLIGLGSLALGVLALLAWLSARSTVYTITTHRIVIRHGIALLMTLNIPFNVIESAALKHYAEGVGEIALTLSKQQRVGYLLTWPHVRPWRITRTQPALRVLADASRVSQLLSSALQGLPVSALSDLPADQAAVPARPIQGTALGHGPVAA